MARIMFPLLFVTSILFLFNVSSAQLGQEQQFFWQRLHQSQQHRLRARTQCRVESITAQEPNLRFESEHGVTEFWDRNNEQFQCAGIAAVRNVIRSNGLLLPHYNSVPQLLYVVQGQGLLGAVVPGCAETYERDTQQRYDRKARSTDRHQKVRRFRQGDVLALPAGMTLWFYNHGQEDLVTVAILDTGSDQNQLDWTFRNFFLAGRPRGGPEREEEQQRERNNVFHGFDDQILSDVFNVDSETIRQLKGREDNRGQIVRAEKFNVVYPRDEEEERQERMRHDGEGGETTTINGLEETLCTVNLKINLDKATRADVYNPYGGRLSTFNSQKLPILGYLRLSAEKGVLYRNGILAPHWTTNAHSMVYITRGNGQIQIVGHRGKSVFNGEVKEGQLLIVPQNYVVLKRANEGLEWISFKTNDNAMTSQLAGRLSAIRAFPEDVVMNSYGISREDARRLKFSREESRIFAGSRSSTRMPTPFEYAMGVIKTMM